jgi:kynurenine formamidase
VKYIYLSYLLENEIPVYGGCSSLNIKDIKSLQRGDSANVFSFIMENHWGTHIDCPAHFFENGLKAADYSPETWFFQKPFVLHLKLEENSLAGSEDMGKIPEGTDLLLIKSGFSRFRGTEKYTHNNPGLKPEVGIWLRERHPYVRAVGLDFISLSPYRNRALGREAHRAFLDPDGINEPILLIEDMDLSKNLSGLISVWISPLMIGGIDSAPCTVIGVLGD